MRLGMGLGLGNLLSGQPITGLANKYSFNFDGSNDYLDSAVNESLDYQILGDVSFWVKFSIYRFKYRQYFMHLNTANNN